MRPGSDRHVEGAGQAVMYFDTRISRLETALSELLLVQPRPVKIPGTAMTLFVSYTKRDLDRLAFARKVEQEG